MNNALKCPKKGNKTIDFLYGFLGEHPILFLVALVFFSFAFIYYPFVFLGKPFIYSDVGADTENVYYPFFHLLFNKIKAGDFSLWTFNYGLGTNVLTRQPDTMSVFTYLTFIFGKSGIKYCLIWVHLLKAVLCGVLSYRFLSYFKLSVASKIIGSYLYALNGFVILWGQHYFFGNAAVCMILLLVAVEDTLRQKKCTCYIILATSYVLITSFYFSYMSLAFTAIYLIFRIIYIFFTEKKNISQKSCLGSLLIRFCVFSFGICVLAECYYPHPTKQPTFILWELDFNNFRQRFFTC